MNWQPIETAPRDGVNILLYIQHPKYGSAECVGRYNTWLHRRWWYPRNWYVPWHGFATVHGDAIKDGWVATHWMPLPEPPEAA